jgi:RimJ/RimL family protein N-acetyltransferase
VLSLIGMEWKKCAWEDIAELEKVAKSTKNTVKNSKNTVWWGLFDDNKPVGCIGLYLISNARGRIKSIYIKPEYRYKGYGNEASDIVEYFAFDILNLTSLSAITRHQNYWMWRGYITTNKRETSKGNKYVMQITKENYEKH